MKIVDDLRQNIFANESEFLGKLTTEWRLVNSKYLNGYGQNDHERVFLNLLIEEVHKRLPNISIISNVKLKAIDGFTPEEKTEAVLGKSLNDIRHTICWPTYSDVKCKSNKCFEGEYASGTEIDALLIRKEDFCVVEYENSRVGICDNFMKTYRLRRLLDKPFESLFVTKLTTTRQEGPTTFDSFNNYIEKTKPLLDKLLDSWSLLEIVNLSGADWKRSLHWMPL